MTTHLNKAEYQLLAAFRYTLRRFLRFSEESARAVGIKGFPERERMTIGELAERLQIKHHSAVELADRLVSNGLAARELDSADRRQVYLTLTPHGEAVLGQLTTAHREELRRLGPELHVLLSRLSDGTE
jgi:DNA-binding MarR family transcriptional regulator